MNQIEYISKQNIMLDEHWMNIQNIKGNIKNYKETTYQAIESYGKIIKGKIIKTRDNDTRKLFDNKGNLLEEVHYSNGSPDYSYVYEYDSRGNQTKIIYYKPFGTIKHRFILNYDDKDNEIERILMLSDDTVGYKMLFKYDDNGNKIEHIRLKPDGKIHEKIIYKYNSSGEETERCIFEQDGSIKSKRIQKYDKKGNLICENDYGPNGYLNHKTVYNYNEKGKPTDYCRYKSDGSLDEIYFYRYDEHDNAVELIWSHSDGSYTKVYYKYDEQGNEIESCMVKSPINENVVESFNYVYNDLGYIIESNHFVFTDGQESKFSEKYEYDSYGNCIMYIEFEGDAPIYLTEIIIEYN